ncbi:MAG: J domain-containing protein [Spirochaetales bacterium]|nr:J domain-containing protein [Spirochaetales bacterium]
MDIFDRLVNLFRSFIPDEDGATIDPDGKKRYYDPDMQDAWDELDDYLNEEKTASSGSQSRTRTSHTQDYASYEREKAREALRQDYKNLEVPYGASINDVKKGYKKLLVKYHPDKNSETPEKLRTATEITKKINISYKKIKDFERKYSKK